MAGREQKAREGKWNGGFAPYRYKLEYNCNAKTDMILLSWIWQDKKKKGR